MDDVERMYRQLVRIIRATSPQLLTQPFPVSDLYSTILPYRLHRRELGLETNQDYEMAMLELLSGARGYLHRGGSDAPDARRLAQVAESGSGIDPRIREAHAWRSRRTRCGSSMATDESPRPRATCRCRRGDDRDCADGSADQGGGRPPRTSERRRGRDDDGDRRRRSRVRRAIRVPRPRGGQPARPHRRRPRQRAVRRARSPYHRAGEECPHCKGELPAGRPISFCPHCGQDLTMRHCPACGSELEHEWKFCVTCGRAVGAG